MTWPVPGPAWENLMGYSPREESKRAGWFSSITFSRLKNGSSWWAENQAIVAGGLHGWTSSSWVNWNMKRAYKRCMKVWRSLKGQVTQKQCRNTVWACRDSLKKAKTHLELKLVRDIKCNYLGFCRCIRNKRKTRENVDLLLNGSGCWQRTWKRSRCSFWNLLVRTSFRNSIPWDQWESLE